MCDGVLQYQGEEKLFRLICSLGRPLFRHLEAGGSGGQTQQAKKDKVTHTHTHTHSLSNSHVLLSPLSCFTG